MNQLPSVNMIKTGKNITKLRQNAGLSVRDLQRILGFGTPQAIYKWQNGLSLPTIDNLVVLATIFEVTIDEIIAVDETLGIYLSA